MDRIFDRLLKLYELRPQSVSLKTKIFNTMIARQRAVHDISGIHSVLAKMKEVNVMMDNESLDALFGYVEHVLFVLVMLVANAMAPGLLDASETSEFFKTC